MAWGDTGGGYTWQGNIGGKDRYSKIVPANREAYKKRLLQEPYGHLGTGRGDVDRQYWVKPGPSYDDRSGYATNIPSQRGWKEDEIRGPNIPAGIATLQDDDEKMGMLGTAKQFLGGFDFPSPLKMFGKLGESVSKNQEQHRDLDKYFQSTYGDDWRKAKNASFWQGQGFGSASKNQDMSLLSPQGKQAHGYFTRAGITDNDLDAFMNPRSKWFGNEAYLESAAGAEGAEAFKQGMSLIKNAADTSDLHGRMMRGPIQDASERSMELGIGITGRPDWDTFDSEMVEPGITGRPAWDTFDEDITADIVGPGQTRGPVGMGLLPNMQLDYEPLTVAGSGMIPQKTRTSNLASLFGIPAFMDEETVLTSPNIVTEEEEIIPNISDLDYFNQFTPG